MVPAGTCRKLIPEIEVYKVSEKHSQSPQEFPSRVIPHLPTHQPICSETPFFPQTLFWGYQSSCAIPAQRLHIYHPISWLPIVNQLTFTYAHISRRRKRVLKKKPVIQKPHQHRQKMQHGQTLAQVPRPERTHALL